MPNAESYSRQYHWRRWSSVYPLLGPLRGASVLDLGCGIGDQARDLAALGALVTGVDATQEFVDHARDRRIGGARFLCEDVRDMTGRGLEFDGIWSSFTVAYFPRSGEFLRVVDELLSPGGWLAITEIDDLFGHDPLDDRRRSMVENYYERSLEEGLHNFRSRQRVYEELTSAGWRIEVQRPLVDDEFCFDGAAEFEVLMGWRTRLAAMMPRFEQRFGEEARGFDSAFLQCLESPTHRSRSTVWFILARKVG